MSRVNECGHPERKYHAKGMCVKCYVTKRNRSVVNKIRSKGAKLKRSFGLTLDDYQSLLDIQSGVCDICGKAESIIHSGKTRMLTVDHCHKTNAIRGLLCTNCNTMLGQSKDSPEILRKAANYLETSLPEVSDG